MESQLAPLLWSADAAPELDGRDLEVIEWARWRAEAAAWLRPRDGGRGSLDPPARKRIEALLAHDAVAVRGVQLQSVDDLRCLHDTLLVPLLRAGVRLVVECPQTPDELDPAAFVEPGFEHPYTLERLRWVCAADVRDGPAGDAPAHRPLDSAQLAAARARGGVVQVIAPAGSGKTTVLVERVRELLARGAPPSRILCMTFNEAAARELQERLALAGVEHVKARTFHSVGHQIIRAHGLVEGRSVHAEGWTVAQWSRFARLAAAEFGAPAPEASELPNQLAAIRLGELATAEEWERGCPRDECSRVLARIYSLVEREKKRRRLYDFDDMIVLSVRLLRSERRARERWQSAFEYVLVDEYQDIEPAQELLVRILAAPHDNLFVVGDEDQTLYGWRRASVHRMIDLDTAYPALQRVALEHNYRCTPEVIGAGAALIAHNRLRFPKPIAAAPGREPGGSRAIRLASGDESAPLLARKLAAYTRKEIAVLGRTVNALRPYALAAAAAGVRITGPDELFDAAGAQETLEAYFAVLSDPVHASEADVRVILRRPSRGLGQDAAERIYRALAAGASLAEAVERLPVAASDQWRVVRAAEAFAALAGFADAEALIARLGRDGLDQHFAEVARASARPDRDDRTVLDDAQREAAGLSVADYAATLDDRRLALRKARDDRGGIELTTVHRAKGRQWPRVVVVACDEGILPHRNALDEAIPGEGVEAERRIAYVAFTRAIEELLDPLHPRAAEPLPHEAGLIAAPAPPREDVAPRLPDLAPRREPVDARTMEALAERAHEVGLHHALSEIADRPTALEFAAVALKRELAAPELTVQQFLKATGALNQAERQRVLRVVPSLRSDQRIAELPATTRQALAATLRVLARR